MARTPTVVMAAVIAVVGLVPAHGGSARLDPAFARGSNPLRINLGGNDFATDVMIQPHGKIVVAAYTESEAAAGSEAPFTARMAVVRLTADGLLDRTFGWNGKVLLGNAPIQYALSVSPSPSGKLLLAGCVGVPRVTDSVPLLVRLTPSGRLDETFGGTGRVTPRFAGPGCFRRAVALPDGRVIAGGTIWVGRPQVLIARFLADGTLDRTYGVNGAAVVPVRATEAHLASLVARPDGSVVFAGEAAVPWHPDGYRSEILIAGVTATGLPNMAFGTGGATTVNGGPSARASSIVASASGKLFVAGMGDDQRGIIAGLKPDGQLDPLFGRSGVVTFRTIGELSDLVLDAHGRITFVGSRWRSNPGMPVIARLDRRGRLDRSMGPWGSVALTKGVMMGPLAGRGSALIVAGTYAGTRQDVAVARLTR